MILLTKAREAIEQASTFDEVKQIIDKAEAVRRYVRAQGQCLEIQNHAAEVKLRAERKAGELLAVMEKNRGGGDQKSNHRSHDVIGDAPKLADMGIEPMQSHRWQKIASLPEPAFEEYITQKVTAKEELTTAGALRLAKTTEARSRKAASSPAPPRKPQREPSTITVLLSRDAIRAASSLMELFGTSYLEKLMSELSRLLKQRERKQ